MTAMSEKLEHLSQILAEKLGDRILRSVSASGEITIVVAAKDYLSAAAALRDDPELHFEQLVDLTGIDYSDYAGETEEFRFAVSCHLLSIRNNCRLRLRVFAENNLVPMLDSVCSVWPSANWFEREAFDLFGIVFEGHSDLRRILTDYGFIGHPFRKDFPMTGHVEMRYDPELRRVVYEPVSIELRENTPRIIREDNYGGLKH